MASRMLNSYCVVAAILVPVLLVSCSTKPVKSPSDIARTPLYYDRQVTFEKVSRIKPEIVEQCEIETNLLAGLDKQSAKNDLPLSLNESARRLTIEVTNSTPGIIVFGNMGSVPATLDVRFKVIENGKVLHEQNRRCKTNLAGFMGLQPSACNKIEKCAVSQGRYISERISRILYK